MVKKSSSRLPLELETPKLPLANCDACPLKNESMVAPYGDGKGYILIVGEAPGRTEVWKGRPFVGEAGQLLHSIMTEVGIDLERVRYTNAIMCRPPDNRDPTALELKCCGDRLLKEISNTHPKIIMPLGGFANLAVTGSKVGIKKARGKPGYITISGKEYLVLPSVHPAGLLRIPDDFIDLCNDIKFALDICNGGDITKHPPIDDYFIILPQKGLKSPRMEALLNRLDSIHQMSVDLETEGLFYLDGGIVTCALSWKGETAVSFDWSIIRKNKSYKKRLADHLSRIECSFQYGQFDIPWLQKEGIYPNYTYDTLLASYILDEWKNVHSLERQAITRYKAPAYKLTEEQISDVKIAIPRKDLLIYNATDVDYTERLTLDTQMEMDSKDIGVMNHLLIPAAKHFTKFFISGMKMDIEVLEDNGKKWGEEINELEARLRDYPGAGDINFNSPKQIAKYLYDTLSLKQMAEGRLETIDQMTLLTEIQDIEDEEAQDYWKTQSSRMSANMSSRSTSMYMLFWLAQQHEFPRLMVKYRLASKKWGTYYKGLKEAMWSDGRMRPRFDLCGTVTGRQSSRDPNIHGTPRLDTIKNSYIADEGYIILYGDYPQAEVRMACSLAKDEQLLSIIKSEDIHRGVTKRLFHLTNKQLDNLSEVEKSIKRRAAKTIVFGIIYGRTAKGLAPQLGIPSEEAQLYIDSIFKDVMPGVHMWLARQKYNVLVDHEVQSIYGRKRRFPLITKKLKAGIQRQAGNMPVQSSVSDMTLIASLKTCQRLESTGIRFLRWPQIHDSFMIQVEEGEVTEAAHIMKDVMENSIDFKTDVPFGPVEIKCGHSWGDLEKLKF